MAGAALGDHPRSRGVYPGARSANDRLRGSSPLARGLLWIGHVTLTARRIIPARAGFTHGHSERRNNYTDHPRSRGVYYFMGTMPCSWVGSSPLARGLQKVVHSNSLGIRIIPARAGFTDRRSLPAVQRGDHPRSRGVYWPAALDAAGLVGSSPLARGLQFTTGGFLFSGGIIPARAGFTVR